MTTAVLAAARRVARPRISSRAAEKFSAARERGPEDAGGQTEFLGEESGGGIEAVATEPAEEFLRAVAGHDETKHETERNGRPVGAVGGQELCDLWFHDKN
jgi:hypothetical protein